MQVNQLAITIVCKISRHNDCPSCSIKKHNRRNLVVSQEHEMDQSNWSFVFVRKSDGKGKREEEAGRQSLGGLRQLFLWSNVKSSRRLSQASYRIVLYTKRLRVRRQVPAGPARYGGSTKVQCDSIVGYIFPCSVNGESRAARLLKLASSSTAPQLYNCGMPVDRASCSNGWHLLLRTALELQMSKSLGMLCNSPWQRIGSTSSIRFSSGRDSTRIFDQLIKIIWMSIIYSTGSLRGCIDR